MTIRTAKLTDDEVILLRARKARGEAISIKAEADRFSCGIETIRKILRGDTFRHLLGAGSGKTVVHSTIEVGPSEAEIAMSLEKFLSDVQGARAAEDEQEADIEAILGYTRAKR